MGSGAGVVAVSACMSGTRGSGVLSSIGVAPYGYLLSDTYLFMADITNPDWIV